MAWLIGLQVADQQIRLNKYVFLNVKFRPSRSQKSRVTWGFGSIITVLVQIGSFPDLPAIWSSGRKKTCFRKLLGVLPCYLLFAGKLREVATRDPHD
jgi:hypothetical protein